jgi:Nif-specific regulatory protein
MLSKNDTGISNSLLVQAISESDLVIGEGSRNLKNAVNNFKRHFIHKVLEENNWNQTEAAKAMNIQRTYLSKLISVLSVKNLSVNE